MPYLSPIRSRLSKMAGLALLGAVLSATTPGAFAQAKDAAPVVRIGDGALSGGSSEGVASFKNIPYAAPPVGPLRWRPPQPVTPWTGVRDATALGPICEQIYNPKDTGVGPLPMSEDCLQLNVWSPDVAARKGKAPVMVWIHGGGHVNGSGTAALYDGTNLAKQGVVVVTLNYRLGRLGFFAHPALDAEHPDELKGSYGLMDTIAALKWVKANIAKFGGDPGNVTVFGESAGGISVTYLMISPMAKSLFQKAVVESGAGREHGAALKGADRYGIRSAEASGLAFAEANGITDAAMAAAELRALPADVLMKAAPSSVDGGGPIIDGKLFSEDPEQGFAAGRQMKIPFLIGSNSLEWPTAPSAAGAMGRAIAPVAAQHDAAVAAFGGEDAYNLRVVSDTVFTEPAHYLAVKAAKKGAPVWLYRFSFVSDSVKDTLKGAPHASERKYVFDTVNATEWPVNDKDEVVAQLMSRYWTNFAKTGNPNNVSLPHWPKFSAKGDMLLDFTTEATAEAEPTPGKAVNDFLGSLHK